MKSLSKILLLCLIGLCLSCISNPGSSENRMIGTVDIYYLEDARWFQKVYNRYVPLENEITSLQELPSEIKIVFFGGLWQDKTQEALAKLYKTADMAGFKDDQIKIYLVDGNLKSPEELEKSYQIAHVPTYIIEQNGKEISRIEGLPEKPIEQVLLTTLEFEVPIARSTTAPKNSKLVKNSPRMSRTKRSGN